MARDPLLFGGYASESAGTVPLPGVTVSVRRVEDDAEIATYTAERTGFWEAVVSTGGTPRELYVRASLAGYVDTVRYHERPVDDDFGWATLAMVRPSVVAAAAAAAGVTQAPTNGMLAVLVEDCTFAPVAGATVSITPTSGRLVYANASGAPDPAATTTSTRGLVLIFNLPVGNVTVSAQAPGGTFLRRSVFIRANVFTTLGVHPRGSAGGVGPDAGPGPADAGLDAPIDSSSDALDAGSGVNTGAGGCCSTSEGPGGLGLPLLLLAAGLHRARSRRRKRCTALAVSATLLLGGCLSLIDGDLPSGTVPDAGEPDAALDAASIDAAPIDAAPIDAADAGGARLILTPLGPGPGLVELGGSSQSTYELRNDGTAPSGQPTAVVDGVDYEVTSTTCAGPLMPSSTCELAVRFTPDETGARPGLLRVTTDAGEQASSTLSGMGFATVLVTNSSPALGNVTSFPAGIDCGTTCSAAFQTSSMRVFATPSATSAFLGWTGSSCGFRDQCRVVLDGSPRMVTARFAPSWTWRYDGAAHLRDVGTGVAADSTGSTYVVGLETTVTDFERIWVRKLDASGAEVWSHTRSNVSRYWPGIASAPDGSSVVAHTAPAGGAVVKLTPAGGEDWVVSTAGDPADVALDSSGNVLVVGQGGGGAFTTKLNGTGGAVWTVTAPSIFAASVAVDTTGNVFVAGSTLSTPATAWVGKLDAAGATVWTRTYSGTGGNDAAAAVAVCPSGDVMVVGRTVVPGQNFDIWIRRYDAAGNILWTRTVHELVNDEAFDVACGAANEAFVTGYVGGGLGIGVDIWIRAYDASGTAVWTSSYGGASGSADFGRGIAVDAAGRVVSVGYETVGGQHDVWVRSLVP